MGRDDAIPTRAPRAPSPRLVRTGCARRGPRPVQSGTDRRPVRCVLAAGSGRRCRHVAGVDRRRVGDGGPCGTLGVLVASPSAEREEPMAKYAVNQAGVDKAEQLINAGQYVLDSDWGEVQPGAAEQNAYLERTPGRSTRSGTSGSPRAPTTRPRPATRSSTATSAGCTASASSRASTGRRSGGTRTSSWRRTTCCSCWTRGPPARPDPVRSVRGLLRQHRHQVVGRNGPGEVVALTEVGAEVGRRL